MRRCGRAAGCCARAATSSSVTHAEGDDTLQVLHVAASFEAAALHEHYTYMHSKLAAHADMMYCWAAMRCTSSVQLLSRRSLSLTLCIHRFWSNRQSHEDPKLVPHKLPGVAEMQLMIHDLPLRSADTQRLRNSLYPDGSLLDGLYLRVLQVCTSRTVSCSHAWSV
jgi:hypothetical protein